MSQRTVICELTGKSALLMNQFPLDPIKAMEKKSREEQAEIAAYRDPQTKRLYLPGVAVQRALIAAAVYSKGKGRASLQKPVAACVLVSPERIDLGVDKYEIDTRPVVVPATKGRVLRHRPRLDKWAATCEIEFDDTLLKEEELRQIVDDMGSRVGLLDFRPERKGPFGRCFVTKWELLKLDTEGASG